MHQNTGHHSLWLEVFNDKINTKKKGLNRKFKPYFFDINESQFDAIGEKRVKPNSPFKL
ncbi:hypothetical protein BC781_102626 [Sediminitomix flava]|uniref:Uncharacterized protein n=1 Tax=Sediminitomix flava TaxID=379075 RepID=A0A315ZE29_SEDFL|nr:hypothetical protein BC781_102626 [Sediminitomix flava]